MLRSFYFLIALLFAVQFSGCNEGEDTNPQADIEYIKYGTSFGQCLGYCINEITINNAQVVCYKNGWNLDESLPEITETTNISESDWTELTNNINLTTFYKLDSVYGCPDCADGGAEWIEIKKSDQIHKVSFEYLNEPEETKNYINNLRTIFCSFDK